ncbi:MAG TPA: PQQ-binding-like beta-propeller repeat protein [Nevskiaceae bacterium]
MRILPPFCAALAMALPLVSVAQPAFGPSRWPQYRMTSTNNAIFDNGSSALPDHHFATSEHVVATPVIVGNRLYVGNDISGGLFAFDVRSGKLLWGDESPWWRHAPNWVHSDMVYVDDRIYVGYGNRLFHSDDVRGTGESGVMALDPATGATLWDHRTVGEVMPTPVYWHGEILAATGAGRLLALDAATGRLLWDVALPGWVSMSSPNLRGDTLYVGALNSVVAVDLKAHRIRWRYDEIGSFTDISPSLSANGVVVMTARKFHDVMTPAEKARWPDARQYVQFIYGFDAGSGKLLWKTLMGYGPEQADNTAGATTIAGDRVYVGSPYTWSFFCFDVNTGRKLWEYRVNASIKGAPAIKGGLVFFGDGNGYLHVLDATTGEPPRGANGWPVGKRKLGGTVNAARDVGLAPGGPVIINQDLFVGSQDGTVYRVDIPAWIGRTLGPDALATAPTEPAAPTPAR